MPGGICLAYANRPQGPWIEYGKDPIIRAAWPPHHSVSHVSGPDVKRLFLYYHGENNVTRLAVSEDGVHFAYGGTVVTTDMFERVPEASYGRVFGDFVSPTNPAIMSHCFLEDDGGLLLFFNIGPRLKNKIALAIEAKPE